MHSGKSWYLYEQTFVYCDYYNNSVIFPIFFREWKVSDLYDYEPRHYFPTEEKMTYTIIQ